MSSDEQKNLTELNYLISMDHNQTSLEVKCGK
jgi:hypothetical protein